MVRLGVGLVDVGNPGRLARVTLALLVAAVAVACGPAEPPPAPSSGIPLSTEAEPPSACMAARAEGTLVRDERTGLALQRSDGLVHQVIWPYGSSARTDGARLVLLDASGTVVAHEGDRVELGGGEVDANGTWLACGGAKAIGP